jgi:hypothetical protein
VLPTRPSEAAMIPIVPPVVAIGVVILIGLALC